MKIKKKKITITKDYLDELKAERDNLRMQLDEVELDRKKHRDYYVNRLRAALETHGKGQTWCMSGVIESLAKHMNSVERWYWG